MRLSDLLSADRAVVPLEAETLPAAAHVLLERLVAAGSVSQEARLRDRVAEERPEDLVGMGDRAFLLHYRTDAVRELTVVIGTSLTPICRELGEGDDVQCARIMLLVLAPPRQAALYLQVVGALARLLSKPDTVAQVLAQPTAEALVQLPAFFEYELRAQLAVRDLMSERPRSVSPDTPLKIAALEMSRSGVRALPVVDEGNRVIGMLSERELLRHLLSNYLVQGSGPPRGTGGAPVAKHTVRDVMTRQVLCVSPEQPIAEVASIMTNKDVERVPVVRDGKLVGFLTRGDIVRKLIGS